jgi:hypothetical protein
MRFAPRLLLLITCLALLPAPVRAVDGEGFELDGDLRRTGGGVDWADLFDVVGTDVPEPRASLPDGFGTATFVRDFKPGASGPDGTTFTQGSKDTLSIAGGWSCAKSNNVGDKVDVVNAYATAFVNAAGEVFLYFALERFGNDGDSNLGFWFTRDSGVECEVASGSAKKFSGDHEDGDLLIVAELTQGGDVDTIRAYRWMDDGVTTPYLDTSSIAAGGECDTSDADPTTGSGLDVCAIVNHATLTAHGPGKDVPWLTETKAGDTLGFAQFMEGGINLSAAGLVGCFTGFLADTRQSPGPQSDGSPLSAALADYAFGDFNLCGIDVEKRCAVGTAQAPNPAVDADGTSLLTRFDVTVTNTGVAPVENVRIQEDASFDAGESCAITALDGQPVTPVPLAAGAAVRVADSIESQQSVVARVTCDSLDNPFRNAVTAYAEAAGAALNPASDRMEDDELCSVVVNPRLSVKKECRGVRLVDVSGVLSVEVEVGIEIENTGTEKLVSVKVTDDQVATLQTVNANGDPVTAFPGWLLPGQKAFFRGRHVPSQADGGVTDPGAATFSDRVEVEGRGALSGTWLAPEPFATASCPLCPSCCEE